MCHLRPAVRVVLCALLFVENLSVPDALGGLLGAVAESYDVQRRLATEFKTCEAARDYYGTDAMVRDTFALVRGTMRKRPAYQEFGANSTLMFIHIPKNAGYTIERIEYRTHVTNLKAVWKARGGNVHDPKNGIGWNSSEYDYSTGNCTCQAHHVPPRYFDDSISPFGLDHVRTFCVVRDPLDKLLSARKRRRASAALAASSTRREIRAVTCHTHSSRP